MSNTRYNVEVEVITPISIGAGAETEWAKGVDYVTRDGKAYILDLDKMVNADIDINRVTELFETGNGNDILSLLGNNLEECSKYTYAMPADSSNPIKTCLKSKLYDVPVIAGSSLKGAIRSVLFSYLKESNQTKDDEIFGEMKDGSVFTRFIQIGDILMPSTALYNSKIFNLHVKDSNWYGGWKHSSNKTTSEFSPTGFNTIYECIKPGLKGVGNITLANQSFSVWKKNSKQAFLSEKKKNLMKNDIVFLFSIINKHTMVYLEKEKEFFTNYPASNSAELVENIEYLQSLIPQDNSYCIIKMSAGVGFHSITGDWQYDDYCDTDFWTSGKNEGKKKYKSRKIILNGEKPELMGFVKIKAIEDTEYNEKLAKNTEILHNCLESRTNAILKLKEDKLKAEEEKNARETIKRQYYSLVDQAESLFNDKEFQKAIDVANEAASLLPEGNKHQDIIKDAELQIKVAEAEKQANEAAKASEAEAKKKAEEKKAKYNKPFNDILELEGIVAKNILEWSKIEGHIIGETEYNCLTEFLSKKNEKERKDILKKRDEFTKGLGKSFAKRLYKELR